MLVVAAEEALGAARAGAKQGPDVVSKEQAAVPEALMHSRS